MDAMGYGKPACLGHNLFVRDQVLKLVAGSNPLSTRFMAALFIKWRMIVTDAATRQLTLSGCTMLHRISL